MILLRRIRAGCRDYQILSWDWSPVNYSSIALCALPYRSGNSGDARCTGSTESNGGFRVVNFVFLLLTGILILLAVLTLIRRGATRYLDLAHGYLESPGVTDRHPVLDQGIDPEPVQQVCTPPYRPG